MSFSTMMEHLQIKEKGKIVLVNTGAFYIARGRDAIFLHDELGLKLSCLETEICKIGFPIASLEKYLKKLEEKGYSYIVYKHKKAEVRLELVKEYKGKRYHNETRDRFNCIICSKGTNKYKEDKYMEAFIKLYEDDETPRK